MTGGGNGAQAEARDGGGAGVRTHLESAEDLRRRGGLITEPEDEDAGQDLFGREQAETAGMLPELQLCGGRRGECDIGQSIRKRGVTCLIEGCKPLVKEVARRGVGDEA